MTGLIIALRLVHVVCGVLWVGMAVFTGLFLGPSMQEVGPDAGKVMAALQRRGLMTVVPALALATLISGLALYWWSSGGLKTSYVGSATGMAFGTGALAAISAYAAGMIVVRPSMMRAAALMQTGVSLPEAEREQSLAEAARLRARSAATGRVVAFLLIFAAAAMGVARYL